MLGGVMNLKCASKLLSVRKLVASDVDGRGPQLPKIETEFMPSLTDMGYSENRLIV
jgi:hypothetical protein